MTNGLNSGPRNITLSKPTVFIDGEAGTTGLHIRVRLEGRTDLELVSIDPTRRKDDSARRELLNGVDVAVLCLPDEAAREAVKMIENPRTRVLDASSAHRVSEGWTYGLPELTPAQADQIRAARLVSNPGCYATGMIALVRPLVDAGLLSADLPLSVNGASGYSGGGRTLIDAVEGRGATSAQAGEPLGRGEHPLAGAYKAYALSLAHKHAPEMQRYGGLAFKPLFTPNVGAWRQGMLVGVPLHTRTLPSKATGAQVHAALSAHYAGARFVRVMPFGPGAPEILDPEALNGTNDLELFVFENKSEGHVLLMARLDNLGKGASGQAVQNLDLMLGLTGEHTDAVEGELPDLASPTA